MLSLIHLMTVKLHHYREIEWSSCEPLKEKSVQYKNAINLQFKKKHMNKYYLRAVPTIVIAHTFCASPDTRISYRQCLLMQGYFCAV